MAFTLLIVTLVVVLLLNLLVHGGLLWLACRIARITGATYRRALVTVLFTAVVGVLLDLVIVGVVGMDVLAVPLLLVRAVAVPLITVRRFLAPNLGKTLLAWLLWTVFGTVFAVPVFLILWLGFMEAFIVPTGAMADTIQGYHKDVTCPKCGHAFAVNASDEAEPSANGPGAAVVGCTCPNCRWHIDLTRQPGSHEVEGGDRILATKGLIGPQVVPPERYDLVVFRHPPSEGAKGTPMNYVKRLLGLPGEVIGIHYGDLYVLHGVEPTAEDRAASPEERWQPAYMHRDEYWQELEQRDRPPPGRPQFTILRKPPDKILALKRLVYDNDHPAEDLKDSPRWADADGAWTADQAQGFRHGAQPGDGVAWLRYRHLLRRSGSSTLVSPELVTDFSGYNTWESAGVGMHMTPRENWVGDLILDCEVTVEQPSGSLVLELSESVDRFRARFDLASGLCTLTRQALGEEEKQLADGRPKGLKQTGTRRLRFANVDDRLTVWVGDELVFGDGVEYQTRARRGPTKENDLEPAGIGAEGTSVSVRHLKLWRDTYYTGGDFGQFDIRDSEKILPDGWAVLGDAQGRTLYVQPGHYLCLGDNSPESSDSRSWGLVPERLLIGRAVLTYAPFLRWRRFR